MINCCSVMTSRMFGSLLPIVSFGAMGGDVGSTNGVREAVR